MIYDCFTFFNELDILNARLHELDSVVDRFVIVESTTTFSNRGKTLFFEENKALYEPFLDKIIHVVVADMPMADNAWINETFQRNAIVRGLVNAHANDLVMMGDVDEIPDRTLVPFMERGRSFNQRFFYYDPYTELVDYWWHGTMVGTVADFNVASAQDIREQRYHWPKQKLDNDEGWQGWHLSYFGGVERIQAKIESMSDVHLNVPEYTNAEHLREAIDLGRDLFNRDITLRKHLQSPIPERILQYL